MKQIIKTLFNKLNIKIERRDIAGEKKAQALRVIYIKYQNYTMIPETAFIGNLKLTEPMSGLEGDVYECGVWKGGMSGGIATLLGNKRNYYLFDSFEGLPEAKEIDGASAIEWQLKTEDPSYYDNCSAEEKFANQAMSMAQVNYTLKKGWFSDTLPIHKVINPIAILRLDGDWYESTMDCLKYLYPHVIDNGLVIIDDYYAWDGCSKAVHDYLSSIESVSRVRQSFEGIAYITKKDKFDPQF